MVQTYRDLCGNRNRLPLEEMGMANELILSETLETERLRGGLPEDTNVHDITGYLLSVSYSLSVLAKRTGAVLRYAVIDRHR